jgi:hypothetical protein
MIVPFLAIGAAVALVIGWQAARSQARAETRRQLARARADMLREVRHWQEAAARATAEAARVAREADAFKAGCQSGREDVISIVPLLMAAQRNPAREAHAGGDER